MFFNYLSFCSYYDGSKFLSNLRRKIIEAETHDNALFDLQEWVKKSL